MGPTVGTDYMLIVLKVDLFKICFFLPTFCWDNIHKGRSWVGIRARV